jgi:hypothetical protein
MASISTNFHVDRGDRITAYPYDDHDLTGGFVTIGDKTSIAIHFKHASDLDRLIMELESLRKHRNFKKHTSLQSIHRTPKDDD